MSTVEIKIAKSKDASIIRSESRAAVWQAVRLAKVWGRLNHQRVRHSIFHCVPTNEGMEYVARIEHHRPREWRLFHDDSLLNTTENYPTRAAAEKAAATFPVGSVELVVVS